MTGHDGDVIDILLPTYSGGPWIDAFLASLQAQTHRAWRLWTADDGSRDDTVARVAQAAAGDARIHVLAERPPGRGAAAAFAWLWAHAPADSALIAFADQDDVWQPDKLARSLAALRAAEDPAPNTPVLVHTDLEVVDAALRTLAPSLRRYAALPTGPRPLRRVLGANTVTGCTVLCNRALREQVGLLPADVAMHDWWLAAAAAAFGRTVYLDTPTVRYRQHGRNAIGAHAADGAGRPSAWANVQRALRPDARVRADLDRAAAQAAAFLAQYEALLAPADRAAAAAWAQLPPTPGWRRRAALWRLYWPPERGWWRTLAQVWRG